MHVALVVELAPHGLPCPALEKDVVGDDDGGAAIDAEQRLHVLHCASTPNLPHVMKQQFTAPAVVRSCVRRGSRGLPGGADQGAEFAEPVAPAVDVDDRDVVQKAVEDGGCQALVATQISRASRAHAAWR